MEPATSTESSTEARFTESNRGQRFGRGRVGGDQEVDALRALVGIGGLGWFGRFCRDRVTPGETQGGGMSGVARAVTLFLDRRSIALEELADCRRVET